MVEKNITIIMCRWQAIDFARLNHRTVSFFNFGKPESAASRWNRISLNASKVYNNKRRRKKYFYYANLNVILIVVSERCSCFFFIIEQI